MEVVRIWLGILVAGQGGLLVARRARRRNRKRKMVWVDSGPVLYEGQGEASLATLDSLSLSLSLSLSFPLCTRVHLVATPTGTRIDSEHALCVLEYLEFSQIYQFYDTQTSKTKEKNETFTTFLTSRQRQRLEIWRILNFILLGKSRRVLPGAENFDRESEVGVLKIYQNF